MFSAKPSFHRKVDKKHSKSQLRYGMVTEDNNLHGEKNEHLRGNY